MKNMGILKIINTVHLFIEFDRYYLSLRPKAETDYCNISFGSNIAHSSQGLIVNCRNVWFQEFWSQHNKCSFNGSRRKCTGRENIVGYEQEGLVPFVSK